MVLAWRFAELLAPGAELWLLVPPGSELVLIDMHRGQAVQISNDTALRHQFQRDLVFQTGRPIDRNLKQLAGLKRLIGREQKAFYC